MATETPKRTRNWPALDAAHRKRGAFITVLFDPHAAAFAPAEPTSGRGRPLTYSDAHIEALLTVKVVLRLSLRAVEGFATGMATLVGAALGGAQLQHAEPARGRPGRCPTTAR